MKHNYQHLLKCLKKEEKKKLKKLFLTVVYEDSKIASLKNECLNLLKHKNGILKTIGKDKADSILKNAFENDKAECDILMSFKKNKEKLTTSTSHTIDNEPEETTTKRKLDNEDDENVEKKRKVELDECEYEYSEEDLKKMITTLENRVYFIRYEIGRRQTVLDRKVLNILTDLLDLKEKEYRKKLSSFTDSQAIGFQSMFE